MQSTAPLTERANVTAVRVGNGRTPHYAAGRYDLATLCGRQAGTELSPEQAAKMGDACKRCTKAAEEIAAANEADVTVLEYPSALSAYSAAVCAGVKYEPVASIPQRTDVVVRMPEDGDVLVVEEDGLVGVVVDGRPYALTTSRGDCFGQPVFPAPAEPLRILQGGRYAKAAARAAEIARDNGWEIDPAQADQTEEQAAPAEAPAPALVLGLAPGHCVHGEYAAGVEGDPAAVCARKGSGALVGVFTDEGCIETFDCAVQAASAAYVLNADDEDDEPLHSWALLCLEHEEQRADACEGCAEGAEDEGQADEGDVDEDDLPDEDVLPFHGPESWTGPRAVCGYDDHLAPVLGDGKLREHERDAGRFGMCPGSLRTPRTDRHQLTRQFSAAVTFRAPRDTFPVALAKPGDVVRIDGQEHRVEDVQTISLTPGWVAVVLDGYGTGPLQYSTADRLPFTRRVRRNDAMCEGCGVYVVLTVDEAVDGIPRHRTCGVCHLQAAGAPSEQVA